MDGAIHGLPNPGEGIRREFRALVEVEAVDGPREAKETFLHQVHPVQGLALLPQPEVLDHAGAETDMSADEPITQAQILFPPHPGTLLLAQTSKGVKETLCLAPLHDMTFFEHAVKEP